MHRSIHKAVAQWASGPGGRGRPFIFVGFFHKSQTFVLVFDLPHICNGKNKGLALGGQNEEQNAFVLDFDFLNKMKNKIGASKLFPFGLPFSTPFSIPWNVKQECRT